MRTKFEIRYPQDHDDPNLRGTKYKPPRGKMIIMNSSGIFFVYTDEPYGCYALPLSNYIPKYDVIWKGELTNED